MADAHDHSTAGHPGRDETIQRAKRWDQWPGMNQWIANYVKGCATCQQNKILTHRKKTPLYRITTNERALPFQQIAMDLITGLPTHSGKNAILTIVDHGCSRAAIFLPCTTAITGPGIAQLYLDHVYRWFGLPTKVISDRDPRFTSHFGKSLTQKLGVRQNLSTAFHPQTDGISERKNQWVEQYLRLVTSNAPEDWTQWMAIASAVHNNRKNETTGLSPNQILLGYETALAPSEMITSNNEAVEDRIKTMMERRAQAIDAINQANKGKPVIPSQYEVGTQVWLEATHLKIHHQKTKLAPKRYGPFPIIKEISPVAYQLRLPAAWGIHDVFHASLLSPYHETTAHGPNFSRPPPELIDGEEEYQVERILGHRYHGRAKALQYLIKWVDYPESNNTWEPAPYVHAQDLIKAYHRRNPLAAIRTMSNQVEEECPAPLYTLLPADDELSFPSPASPLPSPLSNTFPPVAQDSSSNLDNPFDTTGFSIHTNIPSRISSCTPTSAKTRTTAAPFTTRRELPCPTYRPACPLKHLSSCPSHPAQPPVSHHPSLSCCPHLRATVPSPPVTPSQFEPTPLTQPCLSPPVPLLTSSQECESTSPRPSRLARDCARLFGDEKRPTKRSNMNMKLAERRSNSSKPDWRTSSPGGRLRKGTSATISVKPEDFSFPPRTTFMCPPTGSSSSPMVVSLGSLPNTPLLKSPMSRRSMRSRSSKTKTTPTQLFPFPSGSSTYSRGQLFRMPPCSGPSWKRTIGRLRQKLCATETASITSKMPNSASDTSTPRNEDSKKHKTRAREGWNWPGSRGRSVTCEASPVFPWGERSALEGVSTSVARESAISWGQLT
jgi:Integrase zinc binding domain/Chromo (CHRromatin Organisation MOdifier) domain